MAETNPVDARAPPPVNVATNPEMAPETRPGRALTKDAAMDMPAEMAPTNPAEA